MMMLSPEKHGETYGTIEHNIIPSNDDCQSTVSLLAQMRQKGHLITPMKYVEIGELDPQDETPTSYDFILAAFYVLFGFVAASAGLFSAFFL
jgi:hypothetical protein